MTLVLNNRDLLFVFQCWKIHAMILESALESAMLTVEMTVAVFSVYVRLVIKVQLEQPPAIL